MYKLQLEVCCNLQSSQASPQVSSKQSHSVQLHVTSPTATMFQRTTSAFKTELERKLL